MATRKRSQDIQRLVEETGAFAKRPRPVLIATPWAGDALKKTRAALCAQASHACSQDTENALVRRIERRMAPPHTEQLRE